MKEGISALLTQVEDAVDAHPHLEHTEGPYRGAVFRIGRSETRICIFVRGTSGKVAEIWADGPSPEKAVEDFLDSLDFWAGVLA